MKRMRPPFVFLLFAFTGQDKERSSCCGWRSRNQKKKKKKKAVAGTERRRENGACQGPDLT